MPEQNPLTQVREAIEQAIEPVETLARRVLFNSRAAMPIDNPDHQIQRVVLVEPLGGPVDPDATLSRWKFTRRFRLLPMLDVNNMDIAGLEEIELALLGCLASMADARLGLAFVEKVNVLGGDYGIFYRAQGRELAENHERWIGTCVVEVIFRLTRSEISTWKPSTT